MKAFKNKKKKQVPPFSRTMKYALHIVATTQAKANVNTPSRI
jgi:hypothetical protein